MKHKKFYLLNFLNKLVILSFIILLNNCSFSESKFWDKGKKLQAKPGKTKILFQNNKPSTSELNTSLKIQLNSKGKKYHYFKNLNNKTTRFNFDFNLENFSKLKLSKNKKFSMIDFDIDYYKNGLFFFDDKGSILNFDKNSKLIWKKNYYNKKEKKKSPILFLNNNDKYLIVADDLAKYYAINIKDGSLVWSKTNHSPFNSEIKIFEDKFFIVDSDNILRCFQINTGKEIWNVKTEKFIIKSNKRLSIVLTKDLVIFTNSLGDISAANLKNGNLAWQMSTQGTDVYSNAHSLKMSDLVLDKDKIFITTNRNDFYSIDLMSGIVNWQQKINSIIKPIIVDDYIFSISTEGYFNVIEKKTGNIIRITDIFNLFEKKKRKTILPTGFTIGSKKLYVTTNNGKLLIIDIISGKTISYFGFSKNKISNPKLIHNKLYVLEDSSIIKIE